VVDFETIHTKIINDSVFIKSTEDSFLVMSKRDLIISYEHIPCGKNEHSHDVIFIHKWLVGNLDISSKDSMEFYPKSSLCPPNVFNLWKPFAMELLTEPYKKDDEGLKMILNHIRILCNNEEEAYQYILSWLSYMFQYPERKSSCITLISEEGAGKTSLIYLLSKIMGGKKVLETKDPARDVWGNFNSLMMGAFLVNLNELEYKETSDAEGKIKALITDPTMYINQKGIAQFSITSHHHFIITTNKENPIKTQKGDRRKFIVRSSDELIKNRHYFEKLYKFMDTIDTVRTCYDCFMEFDVSTFNPENI
jgi:hypothetical protein